MARVVFQDVEKIFPRFFHSDQCSNINSNRATAIPTVATRGAAIREMTKYTVTCCRIPTHSTRAVSSSTRIRTGSETDQGDDVGEGGVSRICLVLTRFLEKSRKFFSYAEFFSCSRAMIRFYPSCSRAMITLPQTSRAMIRLPQY